VLTRRAAIAALGIGIAGATSLAGTHEAPSYDDPDDLYAALRKQPRERIALPGGEIALVFADGAPGLDRDRVRDWVRQGTDAVTGYFGRFPVKHYGLLVIADDGDNVGHGTTYGYAGSATRIHVGRSTSQIAFTRDWVLTHEMLHAALPDLPRRALWLQEGNATYIEPIARARAGGLSAEEVWRQSLIGMPKGEPRPGDGGMDGTKNWARLYWGGATFWLRAEIDIARASGGRRSLQDAMRAINRQSGGNSADWTPEQMMATGDAATGTDALSRLYARFATGRATTDMTALFASLGVADSDGQVVFDDTAPLAALRRSLTSRVHRPT
jgi:predicted metalloprotease with PDZ domain